MAGLPSYDPLGSMTAGTQAGLAIAAQIGANQDRALRMQQLRSEMAYRQMQEQQMAQNMAMQLWQHNQAVQEQADMTKAMAQVRLETMPTVPAPVGLEAHSLSPTGFDVGVTLPNASGQPTGTIPNPHYTPLDQSLLKNVLPVISKYRPQEADNFIANTAMLPYRLAEARRQEALAKAAESGDPGTVKQITAPDGSNFNVFVPPMGRGGVQLVGDSNPQIIEQGGEKFYKDRFGQLKRIPHDTAMKQLTAEEAKKLLAVDPSLMKFDANAQALVPDWSRADDIQRALTVGSGITSATRNTAEKQVLSNEQVITSAEDALKTIEEHPEAVGVRGVIGSAGERVKGQLGMQSDAPTAKARQQLELAFTQLANGLRVDSGNMSRYERAKLEEVGDPTRWQESPATAANMMLNIRNAAIGRQLRLLRDLNKQPDEKLLRQIPSSEIPGMVQDHLLSVEDALRWHQLKQ